MRVTSTANAPSRNAVSAAIRSPRISSSRSSGLRTASRGPLTCSQNSPQRLGELGDRAQEVEQLARLAADRRRGSARTRAPARPR